MMSRIASVPVDVSAYYDEARRCMSVGAYNAAVMLCRVMLMHIAVDRGCAKDAPFAHYVGWLAENNFLPPGGKDWVDRVRTEGNRVNHKLSTATLQGARLMIDFVAMLLRFIYEFPEKLKRTD